ncbi:ABC transporter permease [Ruicaihuangia caeni]|uniref:Transport permease protein n=1 Tax=Ruicaihuangia caeni TaxID=3042517 RepID=A0AAW6T6D5_9MICO|nr:ABC transporter permease [Klugiella sp. YN-L-19]MDI2099396.1 ABC transporter permease [Klugiella sp. YN-L-19]
MSYLRTVLDSRELLMYLTLREVKGKYKRTLLGQLWSLANPLAMMVVYTFIFAFIFRVQPDPGDPSGLNVFALWLLCGLLPWLFFAKVVSGGVDSLVSNAGLIQKVYFPRVVLPLSLVTASGYNWLFEMAVLVIALMIVGAWVLPWLPLVLLMMLLLAVFAAGVSLLVAVANVYFRDTEHLLSIVLQLWMYLTPIIYPLSLVRNLSNDVGGLLGTPITLLDIFRLNPMERFVAVFRQLLYDNRWPDLGDLTFCIVSALLALALGFWVFARKEKGFAEAL